MLAARTMNGLLWHQSASADVRQAAALAPCNFVSRTQRICQCTISPAKIAGYTNLMDTHSISGRELTAAHSACQLAAGCTAVTCQPCNASCGHALYVMRDALPCLGPPVLGPSRHNCHQPPARHQESGSAPAVPDMSSCGMDDFPESACGPWKGRAGGMWGPEIGDSSDACCISGEKGPGR